jgi:hypothetical protein
MNLVKRLLLPSFVVVLMGQLQAQTPVNGYARVSAIAGATLTVTNVDETYDTFEDGEEVIVMQMQDNVAGFNTANNISFGNIQGIANAGVWVAATILSHTEVATVPNTITLSGTLPGGFNAACAQCRIQIITRPLFGAPNYTVAAAVSAVPWNGLVGGVIAFRVNGTLTIGADVDASGTGYRGGAVSANFSGSCNSTLYTTNSTSYGEKGEGVHLMSTANIRYSRGKLINGGGGGSTNNAGGGGGAWVTTGGNAAAGYNCNPNAGGIGGLSLFPYASLSRFYMGGGGGGGQQNNGVGGSGGSGGGIIIIKANILQTLPGSCPPAGFVRVVSSGNSGGNSIGAPPDGAGGGGAGGTVFLDVATLDVDPGCPLVCAANGGNGGSVLNTNPAPGNWVDTGGAGGGGGQGMVACGAAVAAGGNATTSTSSGVGGVADPANGRASAGSGAPNTGVQGFGGQLTLPVQLLYFMARLEGRMVELNWATLSEQDNRLFRVQRSADLEQWTDLTEVPGAGFSSSMQRYSTVDPMPLPGVSYYRLEQEDADGTLSWSDLAPISMAFSSEPLAWPVPADDVLTVELGMEGTAFILVTDLAGRVVDVPYRSIDGRVVFDTRNVATGTYVLTWTTPAGKAGSQPIVVAH